MSTLAEMEEFYERNVFWAGRWDDPVDEMHSQVGYNTYDQDNDRPFPKVLDFIARKIRPDGFSTFRRGNAPITPPAIDVLARAMAPTSVGADRLAALLSAVSQCLQDCDCTTVNRIAMWCAQIGHESAGLRYMEEIASGAAYEGRTDLGNVFAGDGVRFKGRGPIQVTGRRNYTVLSRWAYANGLVPTDTFFVDDPAQLASDRYGFIGVTWYWTTQRPMNDAADARDIVRATQYVNGGTNGLEDSPDGTPGRRTRYNRALALGDQLLTLTTGDDDFMSALTADEQREVLSLLRVLAKNLYPSRSALRHLGEGPIDTIAGIGLNEDGNVHVVSTIELSRIGDYKTIALLAEVAGADPVKYPDRQEDCLLAQRILADLERTNPAVLQAFNAQNGAQK
jgi:predicted chitinase